jgi:hypothetical protein
MLGSVDHVSASLPPPSSLSYSLRRPHLLSVNFSQPLYTRQLYCQNLSLFGKLFIDQKTIFYSVEAFVFYVLTIDTPKRHLAVGFFSKVRLPFPTLLSDVSLFHNE